MAVIYNAPTFSCGCVGSCQCNPFSKTPVQNRRPDPVPDLDWQELMVANSAFAKPNQSPVKNVLPDERLTDPDNNGLTTSTIQSPTPIPDVDWSFGDPDNDGLTYQAIAKNAGKPEPMPTFEWNWEN